MTKKCLYCVRKEYSILIDIFNTLDFENEKDIEIFGKMNKARGHINNINTFLYADLVYKKGQENAC